MKLINNKLALAVCLSLGVVACTPEKTSEEYISAAKTHISENKMADAAIELKNVIRKDLKNSEARFLLGQLYLQDGLAAAAEKEFTRALELGEDINLILPSLLRALNLQNKHSEILDTIAQVRVVNVENIPAVKLYSAVANIQLGNKELAKSDVLEATDVSEDSAFTKLGQAVLEAESENNEASLELVKSVILTAPDLIEAYLLQGHLYYTKADYTSAIKAYKEYFALVPKDIAIRVYLANAYVKSKQFMEAKEHLDFVLKVYPEHAFSNQLKAVVDFDSQKWELSLTHAEKAIHQGLDNYPNRIIVGLSAFRLEKYEVAHANLIMLKDVLPAEHPAHRVLGIVQMHLGYTDKAGDTFALIEGESAGDVDLLVNASYELLQSGEKAKAEALLEKVNDFDLLDPESITKMGILKLSLNDFSGITDLEKSVELAPESRNAKFALGQAYIANKNNDAAYRHALSWIKSNPEDVEGYNLAAKVLLIQEKSLEAEGFLNESLSVDDGSIFARLYFANKAYKNDEFSASIKQLSFALNKSPENVDALKMNLMAHKALGEESKGVDLINNTAKTYPKNIPIQVLAANILFLEKEYDKAIKILEDIPDTAHQKSIAFYQLLSQSYSLNNQMSEAKQVIDDWIKTYPGSLSATYRKVSILESNKEYKEALSALDAAKKYFPEDDRITVYQAHLHIQSKNIKAAKKLLASIPKNLANTPYVKGLHGQIYLMEKEYDKAIPLLEVAYEKSHKEKDAFMLYRVYEITKSPQQAYNFLKQHYLEFTSHAKIKVVLAEVSIDKDTEFSYQLYKELIISNPNNALLLNNLAWVELKLGKLIDAKVHATEALELLPGNSDIQDTINEITNAKNSG